MKVLEEEALRRAEEAIKALADNFEIWFRDEVARLTAARDAVATHGFVAPYDEQLFRTAHDIKGQAETLGYPLASVVCASLCRLLDGFRDGAPPLDIVDHHVHAVRAIAREKVRTTDHPAARAAADALEAAVTSLLAGRPD